MAQPGRTIGALSFDEVASRLGETSILCLPLGAIEQHGRHLPLDTDVVVAEGLTRRIVERWGDEFDLWQLPTVPIGLSREHDWAPGTLSLSIQGFVTLLRDLACDLARALPARNLVILNGHGGNRGMLENLLHELRCDFGLNACAIHPFDLARIPGASAQTDAPAEVHGGKHETAVMLALAPERVRLDRLTPPETPCDGEAVQALVFDRGVTWPWRTDDPRLAQTGIIGDAQAATAELGAAIVESVVNECGRVFAQLLENQLMMKRG